MAKKNRHMPKTLIMKGLKRMGLTAKRVTVAGIRTWEVKSIKTGETTNVPTLEMVYDLFLTERKKTTAPKKTAPKKKASVEVLEGDPSGNPKEELPILESEEVPA